MISAEWSSADARWTVTARRTDTGETVRLTCSWLSVCSGYYRYDEGFRPTFEGEEGFAGQVIHPQHWPEDLDVTGKRIVVIGSGATAVTLVPSLRRRRRARDDAAADAELHPVAAGPGPAGPGAAQAGCRRRLAYPIVRWKNVLLSTALFQFSRRRPAAARKLIRRLTEKQLPAGFDVDTHFNPPYNPWDQRLCLVPDGDLFRTLRRGDGLDRHRPDRRGSPRRASRWSRGSTSTPTSIVTATGLNLLAMGGMTLRRGRRAGRPRRRRCPTRG